LSGNCCHFEIKGGINISRYLGCKQRQEEQVKPLGNSEIQRQHMFDILENHKYLLFSTESLDQ
jgi:hypothetical protein